MKDKFYLESKDFNKEMFHTADRVRFEWNIIYSCNYDCSYCIFSGKWQEYSRRNTFLSAQEWATYWRRMFDLYGRVSMVVSGGEPFIYPGFIDIIKTISEFHYPIHISTNGSGDLKSFTKKIDSRRVSVSLSFHPEYDSLDEVIERKKFLGSEGFNSPYICFCVYPPFLKGLESYIDHALEKGEMLKLIPFVGNYQGRRYPEGYSRQEKFALGMDSVWEGNVKRKGKLCAAGMKSALLLPDGKVVRCGHIGEKYIIGNFFSDDFCLMDSPAECTAGLCSNLSAVPVDRE